MHFDHASHLPGGMSAEVRETLANRSKRKLSTSRANHGAFHRLTSMAKLSDRTASMKS